LLRQKEPMNLHHKVSVTGGGGTAPTQTTSAEDGEPRREKAPTIAFIAFIQSKKNGNGNGTGISPLTNSQPHDVNPEPYSSWATTPKNVKKRKQIIY